MQEQHDAEVTVKDFTEHRNGPDGCGFAFRTPEDTATIAEGVPPKNVRDAATVAVEQAKHHYDPDDFGDGEVIARVWATEDGGVERLDWMTEKEDTDQ